MHGYNTHTSRTDSRFGRRRFCNGLPATADVFKRLATSMLITLMLAGCQTAKESASRFGIPGFSEKSTPVADTLVLEIESALLELGYSPGTVDGHLDVRTEAAIQDYQLDNDLQINGSADRSLLDALTESLKQQN